MTEHIPVMYKEVLEYLNLKKGDCIVDCTMGIGGHGLGIAKAIGPSGHYIGIDRDEDSVILAKEQLKDSSCRCTVIRNDFRYIDEILEHLQIEKINGLFLDLGISSYQLGNSSRGFSFMSDGPLDMRMDKDSFISADDLINSLSEREIASILKNYGQERWHYRIAHYLVRERQKTPITSTKELRDMVIRAIPHRYQNQRIHPATRTFQAFRIAVNRELEALEISLSKGVSYLEKGARVCVIAFHSLEDKIVKEKFRTFAKEDLLNITTKKPLRPTLSETQNNPRSRSARLRVAERIG